MQFTVQVGRCIIVNRILAQLCAPTAFGNVDRMMMLSDCYNVIKNLMAFVLGALNGRRASLWPADERCPRIEIRLRNRRIVESKNKKNCNLQ